MEYVNKREVVGNVTYVTPILTADIGTPLDSAGMLQPGPWLPPYHPMTLPYYLDFFWNYWRGRPFPISGLYGFSSNQVDTANVAIETASTEVQGSTTMPLTPAGSGAYFTPGELIVVGDGYNNWQTFVVYSIAGDTLTVAPRVAPAAGWPAGSYVQHAWGNSTHPAYTYAGLAFGVSVANALKGRCDGQPSLMPPNGAGTGNDLGSMEDQGMDVNGVANVPHGWVSFGTSANITVSSSSASSPVISGTNPLARIGKGIGITGNTTSGSGLKTTVSIPVTPGQDYVLSWHGMILGGSGVGINVIDANTNPIMLASYSSYNAGDFTTDTLCTRSFLVFTVPPGTTAIQLQLVTLSATGSSYFDDFRLQRARESPAYFSQTPLNGRYVIENTQGRPIVVFGDSYAQEGFGGFSSAIQARLGMNTPVINANTSGAFNGTTIATMAAGMAGAVLPYNPAYCVMMMGLGGDLGGSSSQATVQAGLASCINICRQNGIIPVITGVPPLSWTSITQGASPLQWCHDMNDALRAQCALFTS